MQVILDAISGPGPGPEGHNGGMEMESRERRCSHCPAPIGGSGVREYIRR